MGDAKTIPELPGWEFTLHEVGAGSFCARGTGPGGRVVQAVGPDAEAVLSDCRQRAAAMSRAKPKRRRR